MKALVSFLLCAAAFANESFATGLPEAYESVDWIASSGTQWINTEFTPSCMDRVETKIRFLALEERNYALFCARDSNAKKSITCIRSSGGSWRFDRDAASSYASPASVVSNDYYVVMDAGTRECHINGELKITNCGSEGDFEVGSPLVLFATHKGVLDDSEMTNKCSMLLYYFRVYNSSGETVADLQPCRRKSDNKPGLYDLKNGKFLTNAGTGEFKAPLIAVPSGYRAMNWIRSSGAQYIDTGYTPICTDRVVTKFCIINTELSSWQALYCARAGSGSSGRTFTCQLGKTGGVPALRFDYNTGTRGWSGIVSNNCEYVLEVDGNSQSYKIDGNELTGIETVAGSFVVGSSLHLFGTEAGVNLGAYKLYFLKVFSKDGILVCNCVPCERKSDQAAGLYDLVGDRFLENLGTGVFVVGEHHLGFTLIVR